MLNRIEKGIPGLNFPHMYVALRHSTLITAKGSFRDLSTMWEHVNKAIANRNTEFVNVERSDDVETELNASPSALDALLRFPHILIASIGSAWIVDAKGTTDELDYMRDSLGIWLDE